MAELVAEHALYALLVVTDHQFRGNDDAEVAALVARRVRHVPRLGKLLRVPEGEVHVKLVPEPLTSDRVEFCEDVLDVEHGHVRTFARAYRARPSTATSRREAECYRRCREPRACLSAERGPTRVSAIHAATRRCAGRVLTPLQKAERNCEPFLVPDAA